ncbi:hypothetical protein [Aquiflexum sp.]|uniref:hypothetical protein n=1 Tax=Aquiflexum sp. TaxID=1872584 RepID=UPI0035948CA6
MLRLLYFLVSLILAMSCQQKTEYDKVKERELASGKVVEELFLDLKFGMAKKDFFTTCWEWNKKGVLTNGSHVLQVRYEPEMPSGKEVEMFFYPEFENNKLYFMPIEFRYPGWSPTSPETTNDKLLKDVVGLMEGWFGNGFFEVKDKSGQVSVWVKIDGNRLIRIFIKDRTNVRAEMLDLRIKGISEINKG